MSSQLNFFCLPEQLERFANFFIEDRSHSFASHRRILRCPNSHRFGIVNDEAANGRPLCGKGLEVYAAHKIENSSWIAELKAKHYFNLEYFIVT
jgi:hypothetical protein